MTGPMTLTAFLGTRTSAFACWSCSGGTSLEATPWAAGAVNADDTPDTQAHTLIAAVVAVPVATSTATAPCAAPAPRFPRKRIRLRDIRSASTPPMRRKTTVGTVLAVSTIPSDPAPPPCPITANASATGAIADPAAEIR